MLKSIKHIRKRTLSALLHAAFIPSLVSASEKEFSINNFNSQSLNSSSKIVQSRNLIDVDYDITRVCSYYKSAFPHSPYASLDENKTHHLLSMATVIKQAIESIESGEALKRALYEVTTIPLTVNFEESKKEIKREEPSLSYVLNYYQNANKQGSYARLDQNETHHLLRMATIIKHLAPDLSPGDALNHALRILFSEPTKPQLIQIVKEEKESQPVTQTVKLDSDLIQKLNYFKSHYPHSPYANLGSDREERLLIMAAKIKQSNLDMGSSTALGLALEKLFPNLANNINNSQQDYLEQLRDMQEKILGNVEFNRPMRVEQLRRKEENELREKEESKTKKERLYRDSLKEITHPGPTATLLLEELTEIIKAVATRDPELRMQLVHAIETHPRNKNGDLYLNYDGNNPMRAALFDANIAFEKMKRILIKDAHLHANASQVNIDQKVQHELENSERKRGEAILEYLKIISETNTFDTGKPISDILDRVPLGFLHHDIREQFYRYFNLPVNFTLGRTEKNPLNGRFYFATYDGNFIPISETVAVRNSTDPDLANALGTIPPDTFITADVRYDVFEDGMYFKVIVLDLTPIKVD